MIEILTAAAVFGFSLGFSQEMAKDLRRMKLAWERERRYQRRRAGPGHEPLPPAPMTVEEWARRRSNRDDGRLDSAALQQGSGSWVPLHGRVVDAYGRTVGYIPSPQGHTPNPPPTDP